MKNLHILVIDDSAAVRTVAESAIQLMDWDVTVAASGREGVELAYVHRPDMILLDVLMPDISGQETLRRLKEDPDLKRIPVLMITGAADSVNDEEMAKLGAAGLLPKPFDFDSLEAAIKHVIGR